MSTIPLLPPERSHICIALGSALWAHSLAGSGVGAAAAALGDASAPADAGADPPGACVAVPVPQAATSNASIARTGTLRRFLIRYSSKAKPRRGGRGATCCPFRDPRRRATYHNRVARSEEHT